MFTEFFDELLFGFAKIGNAFITDPGIWWFLAPIFILWFAMEIYLGEYKQEKWGFSSSFANAISFTWINIASLRFISFGEGISDLRVIVAFLFLIYGIFLIFATLRHILSQRVAMMIAGPTPIYFASIISTLWGASILDITIPIVLDIAILYVIIWLFVRFIKAKYLGFLGDVEAVKKGEKPV